MSIALFALSMRERPRTDAISLAVPAPIDLGVIDQGKTVPFAFQIANTTPTTIEITDLKASCGCTWLSEIQGKTIAPDASLTISGTLDTKGRRGPMASYAALRYRGLPSGPARDMILSVAATVTPTLRVVPDSIVIDLVPGSREKIVREIAIDSDRVDIFSILDAQSRVPWITAEIVVRTSRRQSSGKSPARLKITIDPAGIAEEYWMTGSLRKSVVVGTSAEAEPSLDLTVLIRKP